MTPLSRKTTHRTPTEITVFAINLSDTFPNNLKVSKTGNDPVV